VFVNTILLRESLAAEAAGPGAAGADAFGAEPSFYATDVEHATDRALGFLSKTTGLLSVLLTIGPFATIRHKGMPRLLAQPEFHDAAALIPLTQLIEDETALTSLLMPVFEGGGLVVRVGMEGVAAQLSSYSMVAALVGEGRPRRALAVFGPTRMDYRRAIPAVLLTSRLLEGAYLRWRDMM
jgi:transcriptional regulator of heat shock response